MAYTRVTEEERKFIYRWHQEDISLRKIAWRLGRAASIPIAIKKLENS